MGPCKREKQKQLREKESQTIDWAASDQEAGKTLSDVVGDVEVVPLLRRGFVMKLVLLTLSDPYVSELGLPSDSSPCRAKAGSFAWF